MIGRRVVYCRVVTSKSTCQRRGFVRCGWAENVSAHVGSAGYCLGIYLSINEEGPTVKKHLAAVTAAAFLILAPAAPALAQTTEPLAPASHVVTQQPNPNPPTQDQDNGSGGKWGLLGLLGLLGLPGLLGRRREQRDTAYRERISPR